MSAAETGTVVLRPMRWWDLAEVVRVERACFDAEPWSTETFLSELAVTGSREYVVAEDAEGRLVGYAGCSVSGPDADVQTIAVAPAARGTGLGRRLLGHVRATAEGRGARRLHLEVRADNDAALTLYRSTGFDEQRRRRGYYRAADPAAPPVDAVLMHAPLGTGTGTGEVAS